MSELIKYGQIGRRINKTWADRESVKGGGGGKVPYNGQGKMNFGQGKVRKFHFKLTVGTHERPCVLE